MKNEKPACVPDSAHFRDRISLELHNLAQSIEESTHASARVVLDQTSVGRLSRMDAMQQQALAQDMKERQELQKRRREGALARIEAGSFGVCCACGDDMEIERLNADPCAVFCLACLEERASGKP